MTEKGQWSSYKLPASTFTLCGIYNEWKSCITVNYRSFSCRIRRHPLNECFLWAARQGTAWLQWDIWDVAPHTLREQQVWVCSIYVTHRISVHHWQKWERKHTHTHKFIQWGQSPSLIDTEVTLGSWFVESSAMRLLRCCTRPKKGVPCVSLTAML